MKNRADFLGKYQKFSVSKLKKFTFTLPLIIVIIAVCVIIGVGATTGDISPWSYSHLF